ncbi:hypothetical protein SKAU_G00080840 [Synaphobranchus kaupii]|uniref:Uncharacterized protein n=1 Tax=Synaphobranchus kaupii TaxID=118154 RepID=A0A9Q1J5H2_SYNKA|nr:hypothetical protein SKAU_G00080840 [Synaphobranchus kaupii]
MLKLLARPCPSAYFRARRAQPSPDGLGIEPPGTPALHQGSPVCQPQHPVPTCTLNPDFDQTGWTVP